MRRIVKWEENMTGTVRAFAGGVIIAIVGLQMPAGAQAPPAPKPGPEHQRLAYFLGKWTSEGEMKAGPMGPGGKMKSTDVCEWYDGRFAVICRSEGTSPMGSAKSLGIMSYSPELKVYTWYGTDSSGTMTMTTVPKGTVKGDTWTFHDESIMGGQTMKMRVTIKEVSPTVQTFLMEVQGADGKWMPMMESKATKVK
jgi:hypothetical protein